MLKLQVNQFMLRHEGRLYVKGDSVMLPDDVAKALVEKSPRAYSLAVEKVEDSTTPAENIESVKSTKPIKVPRGRKAKVKE
jgi:hypothetical protein